MNSLDLRCRFWYDRRYARVVELVDTLALGASASGREGSSPFSRTKIEIRPHVGFLFWRRLIIDKYLFILYNTFT